MFEIADVLAHTRLSVDDERHGVFEVRPDGEDRLPCSDFGDQTGCVAAGTAYDDRTRHSNTNNRVVHAPPNRTFPDEDGVGNSAKPLLRIIVTIGQRLVRAIAA